jgi:hypothetical protein
MALAKKAREMIRTTNMGCIPDRRSWNEIQANKQARSVAVTRRRLSNPEIL